MARRVNSGTRPVTLAAMVPGGSARRHSHRRPLRQTLLLSSTFLRSLGSRPVTTLLRYYGRSDSCLPRRGSARASPWRPPGRLLGKQVSLIHSPGLPTIPSPTTCGRSASSGHVTHRRVEPRPHPTTGSSPNGNSGLHPSPAGSPPHAGRIEFVILRTDRSPPAALHPVLPRRSCSRLQVTLTWRGLSPLRPSALSGAQMLRYAQHDSFPIFSHLQRVVIPTTHSLSKGEGCTSDFAPNATPEQELPWQH
jgi:hypothetical protein